MRTNRKRIPLPFLLRAADAHGASGKVIARSYGNVLEGVFTRASAKYTRTTDGSLWPAVHSRPPFGNVGTAATLATDPAAPSNLVSNASDFSNASWTKTNVNVSANSTAAPDGTTTGDTLTTATAGGGSVYGGVTFTGNGTKWAVFYVQASGTAAYVDLGVYDDSAATYRHQVRVTWVSDGAPTLSTLNGSGSSEVARIRDTGWFRVLISAASVVAANTNRLYYVLPANAPDAAVIAWQAFASDTPPGSGIEVGRVADALYFPLALVPQELTLYVRGIERGANLGTTDVALVGLGGSTAAALFVDGGGLSYTAFHRRGSDYSSTAAAATAYGDTVELRVILSATGTVTLGQSVNAAAEAVAAASAAGGLATTWNQSRLYVGSRDGLPSSFDFTHVAIALGTKTLAEMRDLAEVV